MVNKASESAPNTSNKVNTLVLVVVQAINIYTGAPEGNNEKTKHTNI